MASPDPDLEAWVASDDHLAFVVETDVTVAGFGVYGRPDRAVRALYTVPTIRAGTSRVTSTPISPASPTSPERGDREPADRP